MLYIQLTVWHGRASKIWHQPKTWKSAKGQKQTCLTLRGHGRFAPESGHLKPVLKISASCQKGTSGYVQRRQYTQNGTGLMNGGWSDCRDVIPEENAKLGVGAKGV